MRTSLDNCCLLYSAVLYGVGSVRRRESHNNIEYYVPLNFASTMKHHQDYNQETRPHQNLAFARTRSAAFASECESSLWRSLPVAGREAA